MARAAIELPSAMERSIREANDLMEVSREQLEVMRRQADQALEQAERMNELLARVVRLTEPLERAQRSESKMAVVVLDLDNFKEVNDELGHREANNRLQTVADLLEHTKRRIDSVAQLSGQVFALLLPETDEHGAFLVDQRAGRTRLRGRRGQVIAVIARRHEADLLALGLVRGRQTQARRRRPYLGLGHRSERE